MMQDHKVRFSRHDAEVGRLRSDAATQRRAANRRAQAGALTMRLGIRVYADVARAPRAAAPASIVISPRSHIYGSVIRHAFASATTGAAVLPPPAGSEAVPRYTASPATAV